MILNLCELYNPDTPTAIIPADSVNYFPSAPLIVLIRADKFTLAFHGETIIFNLENTRDRGGLFISKCKWNLRGLLVEPESKFSDSSLATEFRLVKNKLKSRKFVISVYIRYDVF